MKNLLFIIVLAVSLKVTGQEQKINPKAAKAYEDAMLQLSDGFVKDAIPLLGKALEYEPRFIDAYLSLAGVYGELKEYEKSVKNYEKARVIDTA